MQALQEIMMAQGMDERITLTKLQQLKQRAIQCGRLEELEIEGLTLERAVIHWMFSSVKMAIKMARPLGKTSARSSVRPSISSSSRRPH